jgi:hypothetical protein
MRIIDCRFTGGPQGSPEWFLLARCGIPSASKFACVMAKIKTGEAAERRNYRTDLVVERLTGRPLEGFTTAAMKQGTEREPFARMAYEARTGLIVQEVGFCRHDTLGVRRVPGWPHRCGRRPGDQVPRAHRAPALSAAGRRAARIHLADSGRPVDHGA